MTGGKGQGGEKAAQSVTLSFRHGSLLVWVELNEGTVLHKRQTKQKAAIPEVPTQVAAVDSLELKFSSTGRGTTAVAMITLHLLPFGPHPGPGLTG